MEAVWVQYVVMPTSKDTADCESDKKRDLERLGKIDGALAPLATVCERYLRYCSAVDPIDETIMIGHQPWKGPEAYAFRIFPAANKNWFSKYRKFTAWNCRRTIGRFSGRSTASVPSASRCTAFQLRW